MDPRKAAKALILSKDKYLLLLRTAKENIDPCVWDIPGGGVEKGETEEEALVREVREETGIDISFCQLFPVKKWKGLTKKGLEISGIDFLCPIDECPDIILSFEHTQYRWLSEEEILKGEEYGLWIKETIEMASRVLK
jgi:8-oxo-dGTP diphosphatase